MKNLMKMDVVQMLGKMLRKLQTVLTRAFLAKSTLREIKCNFPKMISLVN